MCVSLMLGVSKRKGTENTSEHSQSTLPNAVWFMKCFRRIYSIETVIRLFEPLTHTHSKREWERGRENQRQIYAHPIISFTDKIDFLAKHSLAIAVACTRFIYIVCIYLVFECSEPFEIGSTITQKTSRKVRMSITLQLSLTTHPILSIWETRNHPFGHIFSTVFSSDRKGFRWHIIHYSPNHSPTFPNLIVAISTLLHLRYTYCIWRFFLTRDLGKHH